MASFRKNHFFQTGETIQLKRITYFDFIDIEFSSYFLKGLLELADERGINFAVSRAAPPALQYMEKEMRNIWLWRFGSRSEYGLFSYEDSDEEFLFCIDGSDRNGNVSTGGISVELLEQCRYYFKVNYNDEAIKSNPALVEHAHKILPLPIVFPVDIPQPWRFLPDPIGITGHRWPPQFARRRLRSLWKATHLEEFRNMRKTEKDLDAFALVSIYPKAWNPSYEEMNLRRLEIVAGLNELADYDIVAGFFYYDKSATDLASYIGESQHSRYQKYHMSRLHHADYLHNLARSKLGIYVRGADDCTAFKFGELMAMAKPIVGERFHNNLQQLYSNPLFDQQFAFDDPQDFINRVIYLLENPSEREKLAESNAQTFDTVLAPKPVMAKILDHYVCRTSP